LLEPICQGQQLAVKQRIATDWNARHAPKKLSLVAKLLNADHESNASWGIGGNPTGFTQSSHTETASAVARQIG
jgi:hypothetical protein